MDQVWSYINNVLKLFQKIFVVFGALISLMIFSAGNLSAREYPAFGPLTVRNQNPLYLQTLGLEPARAVSLEKGNAEFRLDIAYSNIFEREASATNEMNLDMELMRLALHAVYGLTGDLDIGLEIPLFTTWGGFLDAFIQEFHKFFGLPNGGREFTQNDLYRYRFYSSGNLIYDAPQTNFSLGDLRLRLKKKLSDEKKFVPGLSLFADIKLPTGSGKHGISNEAFDFGLGLALEKSYKRVHGYLNAEYIVTGASTALEDFMRNYMLAYAAAVEVTLLDSWSVIAQVNGSTPLLANTGMESWDGVPLDLVIGFRGCEKEMFGRHDLIWQVGFSEDVLSEGPSVDFTAFISMGIRFNKNRD